jgi:predicted ABC-type ATPase
MYSLKNGPVLVLVRGIPGSGKSYFAKALAGAINDNDLVMLDPDMTDYDSQEYKKHTEQLTEEGVDPKLHAYRFLRAKAYKGIAQKKLIIWNQPFTNLDIFKKMIDRMQEQAEESSVKLKILIVEVEADPKLAKERVNKRKLQGGHGPSDSTFERFLNDFTSFADLGYKTLA